MGEGGQPPSSPLEPKLQWPLLAIANYNDYTALVYTVLHIVMKSSIVMVDIISSFVTSYHMTLHNNHKTDHGHACKRTVNMMKDVRY